MLTEMTAVQNVESAPTDTGSGQPQPRKLEHAEQLASKVFWRELQALRDCDTDEGLCGYMGGGKRPKVPYRHGRQYAPVKTLDILENAKLIKYQREERYSDGAWVIAYQITAKGERWLETANAIRQKRYQDRYSKALTTSTDPALQKLQHGIKLAEKVSLLPDETQVAVREFLEIISLDKGRKWMNNPVTQEQVMNGKTVMGVMVLVWADTQQEGIAEAAVSAIREVDDTDGR